MNLDEAQRLAKRLIAQHTPWYNRPRFKWQASKCIFGSYHPKQNIIKLSKYLVSLNSEQQVTDTILHEIAHCLTPGENHNEHWKKAAANIGCNAERCYSHELVNKPEGKYKYKCPACGAKFTFYRASKYLNNKACKKCCDALGKYSNKFKYNNKFKYSNKFKLVKDI